MADPKTDYINKKNNKLISLTPSFVKSSNLLIAIYKSVAALIYDFNEKMLELKNSNWKGKGLRLLADENQIFYNKEDLDEDIQLRLQDRYGINQKRGTINGIVQDLSDLLAGQLNNIITYPDKRGWILGFTYPGIDYVFIDAPKLIIVEDEYQPAPGEIPDIIRLLPTIKKKIIPIDTEIIRVQI